MKSLLIINKTQFGYHTDYYKYSEHLKDDFSITFLCFDSGLEKLTMPDIKVKYVSNSGPKTIRGIRFILIALISILLHKGEIFIHYFEKCHILKKAFPKKKMILDVRTLSINSDINKRNIHNQALLKACSIFDHITPISIGVQNKLNLSKEKSTIVPLGADNISLTNKTFEDLRLLYVGALSGRNIDQTILGLSQFIKKHPRITISYDIIGDGNEFQELSQLINDLDLSSVIKMHGRIPHFKLKPFFDNSNIGVSYIPMTEYYEFQPPTKTFEYIMSGMPCIATNTYENKNLITSENGILCDDKPESFSKALEEAYDNKTYNSNKIRKSLKDYTWKNIVDHKLKPVLNKY